jgi:exportin-5
VCLDYDSEEEFAQFFHQCRSELLQTFRQATLVAPLVTFSYVEEWLATRIQKSMVEQGIECNYQSPTYLEWEALSQVIPFPYIMFDFSSIVIPVQEFLCFQV